MFTGATLAHKSLHEDCRKNRQNHYSYTKKYKFDESVENATEDGSQDHHHLRLACEHANICKLAWLKEVYSPKC